MHVYVFVRAFIINRMFYTVDQWTAFEILTLLNAFCKFAGAPLLKQRKYNFIILWVHKIKKP